MEAALETLMSLTMGGKAVAVLGDMLELGDSSSEAHRELGRSVARLGVDILITTGSRAKDMVRGAVEGGMPSERVLEIGTHAEIARSLKTLTRPGDAVLIKGSRGMKMEKVLEEF
jgi:UDP-N-acetylmuramyl pentapeptide synthase